MHRAACLCGSVTWEVEGPLVFMHHCHCARCRKAHGSGFATAVGAPGVQVSGAEHVRRWESSPGFARAFCGRCGSVVPGTPFDGMVFVPAGNFLEDPTARPEAHIFVGSAPPWSGIAGDLPRFEAFPPGVDFPIWPDLPAPSPQAGEIHGSCLCGRVAFVIDQPPLLARFCHCGRCRRARSAACAANLFVTRDGLRVTRGAEAMVRYKLPEAERFTQVFCRDCGAPLPADFPARGVAVVPMGALDTDPGIRPQSHIFVGSKAPWYEIADPLPQYATYPPET